jgi:hypothetical protein
MDGQMNMHTNDGNNTTTLKHRRFGGASLICLYILHFFRIVNLWNIPS